MRRALACAALALVAACSNPGSVAEQRFQMVKRGGDPDEICAAYRAVADAYLQQGDAPNYDHWHSMSGVYCDAVRLSRQIGLAPATSPFD